MKKPKKKTRGASPKIAGGLAGLVAALLTKYAGVDPDLAIIIGGFVATLVSVFLPPGEVVDV